MCAGVAVCAACAAAVSGAAVTTAAPQEVPQQAEQRTIHDGVFNTEQVERGSRVWDEICAECHSTDLFGPEYMEGWAGASVGYLFEELKATMPYDNPAGLVDQDYVDVLAFIFSFNGVKPGEGEMSASAGELNEIAIAGPFQWTGQREGDRR